MTYAEAVELAKQGRAIRCGGFGPGWWASWKSYGDGEPELWSRNPHTGDERPFDISPELQARKDWVAR